MSWSGSLAASSKTRVSSCSVGICRGLIPPPRDRPADQEGHPYMCCGHLACFDDAHSSPPPLRDREAGGYTAIPTQNQPQTTDSVPTGSHHAPCENTSAKRSESPSSQGKSLLQSPVDCTRMLPLGSSRARPSQEQPWKSSSTDGRPVTFTAIPLKCTEKEFLRCMLFKTHTHTHKSMKSYAIHQLIPFQGN